MKTANEIHCPAIRDNVVISRHFRNRFLRRVARVPEWNTATERTVRRMIAHGRPASRWKCPPRGLYRSSHWKRPNPLALALGVGTGWVIPLQFKRNGQPVAATILEVLDVIY